MSRHLDARGGRIVLAEHVRCRQFEGEMVVVDLQGGEYFALDAIATRMWSELLAGKTTDEVAASLAAEYAADTARIARDCEDLLAELVRRRLVVWSVG